MNNTKDSMANNSLQGSAAAVVMPVESVSIYSQLLAELEEFEAATAAQAAACSALQVPAACVGEPDDRQSPMDIASLPFLQEERYAFLPGKDTGLPCDTSRRALEQLCFAEVLT